MPIRLTETVKKLLIVYAIVFFVHHTLDQFFGGNFLGWFALIPAQVLQGKIWQLVTYSFLHADVMHFVLNLLVLAFIAPEMEAIWGRKRFLQYYFFCISVAAIFYLFVQWMLWNPLYLSRPMLGASGGIYGLLLAYGILFPDREMLFMMLFPLKARQFVWVLVGLEFLQSLYSGQSGLGSIAHLSGMGAGFIYLWLQAKGFQFRKQKSAQGSQRVSSSTKRKKSDAHLRLVKSEEEEDGPRGPKTWH